MAYPSTFDDLQNEVISSVGLDATNDLQKTKDWINQVYADVAIETEANVLYATSTLTVGQPTYALPTEIVRITSVAIYSSGQGSYGPPLMETQLEQILAYRQSGGTGTPTCYTVAGYHQLELYPVPAEASTILFYYVALPDALVNPGDTPFLQEPYGSYAIKYGAMAEAASFIDHPREQEYRQLYELWLRKYRGHLNRRRGGHVLSIPLPGAQRLPSDPSVDLGAVASG